MSRRSPRPTKPRDRKSTRLNSSHITTSYAVFCLKKKKPQTLSVGQPHKSHPYTTAVSQAFRPQAYASSPPINSGEHTRPRVHISAPFFFNDAATTEIYTLSLHDALPIAIASMACRRCATAMYISCEPLVCGRDRKSTRLNSSHITLSYAVFCLKKKNHEQRPRGLDQQRVQRLRVLQRPERHRVVDVKTRGRQQDHVRQFRSQDFFFLMKRRPPKSPLFPSTTLFR